jgi:hypothetical protein
MGRLITVEFDLELPAQATDEQIQAWLKYELIGGTIDENNPLRRYYIVADYPSLTWKDL